MLDAAEPLWTADELEAIADARPVGVVSTCTGVGFDSRAVQPGDLFVALQGERDGHDFVQSAFDRGAACALVTRELEVPGPQLVVADTLRSLEAMAAYARERSDAKRAAVTGSVGKTSTTQAILAGLARAGRAHGATKSFNNHIGVPLTLARMPRATERAVFEIGMNHAGEITPLSQLVQPDVVLINNVGPVHTENFPDGEAGVARAKAEIFDGLKKGGTAVLNADSAWFDFLRGEAEARGAQVVSFGAAEGADARLLDFTVADGRARVRTELRGSGIMFDLMQTGRHWGLNSLAVLLVLEAMDVPVERAFAALSEFAPLEGRGAERLIGKGAGAFRLVDESYNANPLSMRASLISLGGRQVVPPGRKIVALTDMLELGSDAERFHADLAQPIEDAGVDLVFCAGPLMKALWDSLPPARQGAHAASAAELAPVLVEAVRPSDVVMVKGSNGSRASTLVAALDKAAVPASRDHA